MKIKYLTMTIILTIILFLVSIIEIYSINNFLFISNRNKQKILNILNIEEADSIKFISLKSKRSGFHSMSGYMQLVFDISIDDYNENKLQYSDTNQEYYLDSKFYEKIDDNYYRCTLQVSESLNITAFKELYNIYRTNSLIIMFISGSIKICIIAAIIILIIKIAK